MAKEAAGPSLFAKPKTRKKTVIQLLRDARTYQLSEDGCSHKSTEAWEELIRRYSGKIEFHAKVAYLRGVDSELEELKARGVQGLFEAVVDYKMKRAQFGTWASQRIRGAITPIRGGCGMNVPLLLNTTDAPEEDGKEASVTVACESTDLLREAQLSEIWRMVDQLPLRQRIVLRLIFKWGESMRKVGEMLGISTEAVSQLQERGIKNLQKMVTREAA